MPRSMCWGVLSLGLLLGSGLCEAQAPEAEAAPEVGTLEAAPEQEAQGARTEATALLEPPLEAQAPGAPLTEASEGEEDAPPLEVELEVRRTAMARALFVDGVTQARRGSFARAADFFRRAYTLRPAPPVAYNLASALLQLGRLIEASEVLQEVIRHAETAPEMRAAAEETVAQIGARLAHVRFVLTGAPGEVALTLDDRPLELAVLGVMVPIDPGAHELAAYRGEQRVAVQGFELAEAAREEIALAIPPLVATRPVSPARPASPSEDLSWLWWTGLGVGAVLLIAVTIGVLAVDGGSPRAIDGTTLPPVLEWR